MSPVSYAGVSQLFQIWRRLLKEPRELLMGRAFLNVVNAALVELEKMARAGNTMLRSQSGWKRELLELLEKAFDENHTELAILRLEYPIDMRDLEALLKQDPIDVARVYAILERIRDAPSPGILKRELRDELLKGDSTNRGRLYVLTWLLFRKGLRKHRPRKLKDLPKSAMARGCTAEVLDLHVAHLSGDRSLDDKVHKLLNDAVDRVADSSQLQEHFERSPSSLPGLFSDLPVWWHASYELMEDAADRWARALKRAAGSAPDGDAVAHLLGDDEALEKIGEATAKRLVWEFLRMALAIFFGEERTREGSLVNELGRSVAEDLIERGAFAANGSITARLPIEGITNLSAEALASVVSDLIAGELCEMFWEEERTASISDVGRRLTEMLADEAERRNFAWAEAGDHDIKDLCQGWAAKRCVHHELGRLLAPLAGEVVEFLGEDLRDPTLVTGDLWERWARWFSRRSAFLRSMPWQTLTPPELDRVLDRLLEELLGVPDDWLAVFRVEGIDSQRTLWFAGEVTFYDPDVYDFGEGRGFYYDPSDLTMSFAKLTVQAESEETARQTALDKLNDALDVLSFALSVGEGKVGGLRPEIDRSSYVYRVSRGTGLFGREVPRSEAPTVQRALDDRLAELAGDYSHLLSLSEDPSSGATELQRAFLRAIHWYRKGRWEQNAAERFLFYWIALEHLFAGKVGVRDSLPEIARLRVTWRSLPTARFLLNSHGWVLHQVETTPSLRAKVNAIRDLDGWDEDQRVLLDPEKVRIVAALASGLGSERGIRNFLGDLKKWAVNDRYVREDVHSLREYQRFKIELLYGLRNRMAHGAARYSPEMETYAEEVENVLENVLQKMADDAANTSPMHATMTALTDALDRRPWT